MSTFRLSERDYRFLLDRLRGLKLSSIARRHGVSRERTRQIIAKCVRRLLRAEGKWAAAETAMAEMARDLRDARIVREEPVEPIERPALTLQEYLREEHLRLELLITEHPRKLTIDDLKLSCRPYNCLRNNNIETVAQLCDLTAAQLLRYKNLGVVSLREIRDELDRIGAVHRLWQKRGEERRTHGRNERSEA